MSNFLKTLLIGFIAGFAHGAEPVRVGVYVGSGADGIGQARWVQFAEVSDDLIASYVDGGMIRAGALDMLDVLVMPVESDVAAYNALGETGTERVRTFVAAGGGYIGTCAGASLVLQPTAENQCRLGLIPFVSLAGPHRTGSMLTTEFTSRASALGLKSEKRRVKYHGGPLMIPVAEAAKATSAVMARFVGDLNTVSPDPAPPMTGAASVVACAFGEGRVVAISDHPEHFTQTFDIVRGALRFATGRTVSWKLPQRRRGQPAVGFLCDGPLGVRGAKTLERILRSRTADVMPLTKDACAEGEGRHFDVMIGPEDEPEAVIEAVRNARPVRVAVYAGPGVSCPEYWNVVKLLEFSPLYEVSFVDGGDIAGGILQREGHDLLLLGGGWSPAQYKALGEAGRAAVTNFVWQGGAYYGICAGAFMALQMSDPKRQNGMGLVPYTSQRGQPYRGWADTSVEFTDFADETLGIPGGTRRSVLYWGGPVMQPGDPIPGTDVRPLVTYRGNTINTFTGGTIAPMAGFAAVVGGRVGKGRVIVCGPHPEGSEATQDIVRAFLRYLTGRIAEPVYPKRAPGAVSIAFCVEGATKAGMAFGMSLLRDPRFDVRPVTGVGVDEGILDHADVLFFPWGVKSGYMGLVHEFLAKGGRVVELDPENKGIVKGERVFHVKSFEEAREIFTRL